MCTMSWRHALEMLRVITTFLQHAYDIPRVVFDISRVLYDIFLTSGELSSVNSPCQSEAMPAKRRRVKTPKKKKGTVNPTPESPKEPSPSQSSEAQPEEPRVEVQLPPVIESRSDGGDDCSEDVRPKAKRVYNNFTERQEELIVEWLQDNPILYNKCLKEYKNKEKKSAMWTEIAVKLDIPEALLHKWYKTMRTQFGKLIQKKSGDGARDYTEREKWVLTNFAFLKGHIVRVASRQVGFSRDKNGCRITSSTVALPSDDSELDDEEVESLVDQEIGEGSSLSKSPASTAPVPSKGKRTKKAQKDTDLQDLIDKLSERAEGSREMREKVTEMVKSLDNPHTAYANYLASMHPSIHQDLWDDYLRKSHDTLMYYVGESKRIRKLEEQPSQMQPQIQQYGPTYNQLQPMVQQQPQQSNFAHCSRAQPSITDDTWGTGSQQYRNTAMSTPDPSSSSLVSQVPFGSLVRQLDDLSAAQ